MQEKKVTADQQKSQPQPVDLKNPVVIRHFCIDVCLWFL